MTESSPVPPALQAAWGLRERPTKGPKPTLSADRIVATAGGLARAEGFAAVSMPRIAGELSASAVEPWGHAMSALFSEPPWFLQLPVAAPPATPRQLAWMEAGLCALTGTVL